MVLNSILNDYTEIRDCMYKGERYSVRDNGAVLRHAREGMRIRKNDNAWTFGKKNKLGYMDIGSERVHRIVAFAFLGEPPTPQHVVDHIDTNRSNNRPSNLRWLTKLENALNNPITRMRIEYYCGSIEAFINDPSIIRRLVKDYPGYEWMRTVTQEEAKASYKRMLAWTSNPSHENSSSESTIGEWVYAPQKTFQNDNELSVNNIMVHDMEQIKSKMDVDPYQDNLTESLTKNAIQRNWMTPTEFPLCPNEVGDNPLSDYLNNLKKGAVITKNENVTYFVDDFALCDNRLAISAHADDALKPFSITYITFENGKYVHEGKTFFGAQGAQKALVLAQGLEWNGEEDIDDYC